MQLHLSLSSVLYVAAPSCGDDQFACGDGMCIFKEAKCDGFSDCSDGSDEKGCGRFFQTLRLRKRVCMYEVFVFAAICYVIAVLLIVMCNISHLLCVFTILLLNTIIHDDTGLCACTAMILTELSTVLITGSNQRCQYIFFAFSKMYF